MRPITSSYEFYNISIIGKPDIYTKNTTPTHKLKSQKKTTFEFILEQNILFRFFYMISLESGLLERIMIMFNGISSVLFIFNFFRWFYCINQLKGINNTWEKKKK